MTTEWGVRKNPTKMRSYLIIIHSTSFYTQSRAFQLGHCSWICTVLYSNTWIGVFQILHIYFIVMYNQEILRFLNEKSFSDQDSSWLSTLFSDLYFQVSLTCAHWWTGIWWCHHKIATYYYQLKAGENARRKKVWTWTYILTYRR